MATILIVDDRPGNRDFLVTLLGYGGHRLLEAGDGLEALGLTRTEHPDLVIADVLMPTMDGYEFVRQLRADPAIAHTRVIFYTAHYHEREARALAASCGVSGVLTKPSDPELVLRTVEAALGLARLPTAAMELDTFDREHLRLITDKLSQKADELRRSNDRLTALVELGLRLGSERDPAPLLQDFAHTAREIIGARYALVGIVNGDGVQMRHFYTSGMDVETAARLGSPAPGRGVFGSLLGEKPRNRGENPGGDPQAAGFPTDFPPIHSWLGVTVRSLIQTYGWVVLIDKIGAAAFHDEDERLAGILAAQVGRIYENGSLYAEVLRQSAKLSEEVAERARAEKRFRTLLESAPDAMIIIDPRGAIALANAQTESVFEYPRDELIGRPIETLLPSRFHERSRAFRESSMADSRSNSTGGMIELLGQRKDGTEFPVEINLSPLQTDDGVVVTIAIRDVTARKVAEESLRASEELLRSAFDHTNVPMALMDVSDHFFRANAAFAEMFGYTQAELLKTSMTDLTYPDDVATSRHRRKELLVGQAHFFQMENRYVHKDGHVLWGRTNISLVRSATGEPLLYVGQVQDVTERKRTETTLLQTQQRLEHVISSSPAVIYTLSIEGERIHALSWISDNVREMMGYSPEEALGPAWWLGNVHAEDRDRVKTTTRQELTARDRTACEYRFLHRDGNYRWVRSEMRLLRDRAGKPSEVVGSWSDVTQRKHLEDQILQAQKMEAIGKLAGGIAHDFNNLLTVINGYCEILLGDSPGASSREPLEEIRSAGERAAALTRQLLAFSRRAVLAPVVLDPNALLVNLQKLLARLIGEDVELKVVTDPGVWKVKVDPGQMEQVIMNLAVNARDAMPRGGKLTIETANVELDESYASNHPETQRGYYVLVAVSDTGHGMDAATKARIFEPFFTTKGLDRGTGLGLAVVHGIVKQSGGRVEVYSEPGIGSTFKVYLPRAGDETPASRLGAIHVAPRRGTETVLLVEDEAGVRSLARLILEKYGYVVLEARNGEEALVLCRRSQAVIHVMVTDMVMPNMSGWQLAQHLAALRPLMKVLYLSGYTDDAVVHHGIINPDTPFLQKPFTPESLASKLREVLDS